MSNFTNLIIMFQAVLDACCDKPVLQHQSGPQCQFRVVHQSEAIVVNSFLLSTIVGSWRDWERIVVAGEDGGVLGTLFRALNVLLRDDHPFREFNASQFNRVRLVEALLLFCKVVIPLSSFQRWMKTSLSLHAILFLDFRKGSCTRIGSHSTHLFAVPLLSWFDLSWELLQNFLMWLLLLTAFCCYTQLVLLI